MKMNPYNMPQIIKETSDGYFHLSVLDDLLSQREIYCLGEIDADRQPDPAAPVPCSPGSGSRNHSLYKQSRRICR